MIRKLLAIITCLLFLLSLGVYASPNDEFEMSEVDEYKKQILFSLDIYASPDNEGYITNGEFSKAILRAMTLYSGESGEEAAEVLRQGKIIPSALSFLHSDTLKTADALKVVINALGYGSAAEYAGFEQYISRLKLDKGLSGKKIMEEADCINLLYNMLTTPVYSVSSVTADKILSFTQGDIFASVYLEAVVIKGTVVATEFASLSGYEQKMQEGSVCVDETFFDADNTTLGEQLGKRVEVFGIENEKYTYSVCGYVILDDASEEIVPLKDVIKVSGFMPGDPMSDRAMPWIEYEEVEKKQIVREKMSSTAKIIYNGMETLDITNADFLGENGSVTLRDFNDDNIFDIVLISRYVPGRVTTVDKIYEKIILDDKTEIDYSEAEVVEVISGGRNVDMFNVTGGSVIGVYQPKSYSDAVSERVKIEIFSTVKNGTVSLIDKQDLIIGINGESFPVLPSLLDGIELGHNYDFFLNGEGVAVYVSDRGPGGEYIYYIKHGNERGIEAGLKVRAVNMNSEYKIYDVCNKVRYTGLNESGVWVNEKSLSERELSSLMDSVFTSHVLIKVHFSGGEIAEIIAAEDMSADDYKGYTSDKFTMDYSFLSGDYARKTDRLGLNHKAISGTTIVVMDDLSEENDGVEVLRYSAGNSAVVSEESYYMEKAWIYDSNNELEVGVFVMTYDPEKNETLNAAGSAVLYQATAMLVEKVTTALNSSGEESYKVYGYMDGKRVSYVAKNTEVTQKYRTSWFDRHCRYVKDLKFGDVIVPTVNSKGEMSEFYLLASPDDESTPVKYIEPTSSSSNTAYGKVLNNYDNVVVRLECAPERLFLITDSLIHYVCDFSEGKIYLSDGSEYINDSQTENPDTMFILRWGLYIKQTVVYRR